MTYCIRIGILGVALGALLGGCTEPGDGMAEDQGVELGTYLLTPENRDFRFDLLEDGTFESYGLEWDLQQFSSGVWSVEDGVTMLRPENDDPMADSVRDDLCPTRCFGWSTTDGFTKVTLVELEPTDNPEIIEASLYDRVEEKDVVQTFVLGDPDAPPPGI